MVVSVVLALSAASVSEAGQHPGSPSDDASDMAWHPTLASVADAGQPGMLVRIRLDLLKRATAGQSTLTFPLTDGLSVRAAVTVVQSDVTGTFVAGPLLDAVGEASITVVGDTLVGRILADGRTFMVRRARNQTTHLVSEVHSEGLPPEAPPRLPPTSPASAKALRERTAADSNGSVDVMVLYTTAVRGAVGGTSAALTEAAAAVNNANLALANAGVSHRFRLVYAGEVPYSETGDIYTTLDHLTISGDGQLDGVPALRNRHGADVVTLLSADINACGLGWLMTPDNINDSFERYAYNVVAWNCAGANLTLAHEIGHNMGLQHDRPNAGTAPSFPYAYGYAVPGVARDVMAYPCTGSTCPRLAIFSTPIANFPGKTIRAGTVDEDSARALNNTSLLVANFRQTSYPSRPNDFDGDGLSDVAMFRPSNGTWFILHSGSNFTMSDVRQWGTSGDVPVPGDYDGDTRTDIAVYRPGIGAWFILKSSTNFTTWQVMHWGTPGDRPVTGDYDGDRKTDLAVFRPSNGLWFILRSSTNYSAWSVIQWGASTDVPLSGDYDGDGKTDLAVYRPGDGTWFILKSTTNNTAWIASQWGATGDLPVAADYDGDRKTDLAVYRPTAATWFVRLSTTSYATWGVWQWGSGEDVPAPGDYDGDGKAELALYRPSVATWFLKLSTRNYAAWNVLQWGLSSDQPAVPR